MDQNVWFTPFYGWTGATDFTSGGSLNDVDGDGDLDAIFSNSFGPNDVFTNGCILFSNFGEPNTLFLNELSGSPMLFLTDLFITNGSNVVVCWMGSSGLQYTLQRNDRLEVGAGWMDVAPARPGTSGLMYETNTIDPHVVTALFYRVEARP